ncbi:hypothetical protein DdX_16221 [Ditylenchus destructor]|uniref:7TM GPCR serpentine receptor class x (Srx) domain-containing protein n=1 Tax=Ditylenchus destructor TaxID=166010 RepID=A0AAD4MQS8_9BILA|nr:hypothetical protein DdX_16221 [Ditylenchus destructor]
MLFLSAVGLPMQLLVIVTFLSHADYRKNMCTRMMLSISVLEIIQIVCHGLTSLATAFDMGFDEWSASLIGGGLMAAWTAMLPQQALLAANRFFVLGDLYGNGDKNKLRNIVFNKSILSNQKPQQWATNPKNASEAPRLMKSMELRLLLQAFLGFTLIGLFVVFNYLLNEKIIPATKITVGGINVLWLICCSFSSILNLAINKTLRQRAFLLLQFKWSRYVEHKPQISVGVRFKSVSSQNGKKCLERY